MYKIYILYSHKIDKYYIGYSSDVDQRLRKHNNASRGFTNTDRPWILVYTEEYETKQEAAARERQIKNWKNRSRLEDLIKKGSEHPDFQSGGS
jgi:putative endonuclease